MFLLAGSFGTVHRAEWHGSVSIPVPSDLEINIYIYICIYIFFVEDELKFDSGI